MSRVIQRGPFRRFIGAVACGIAWIAAATISSAAGPATVPARSSPADITIGPIHYRLEVGDYPPQRIYLVTVDLRDPRVSVRVARGGPDPDGDGRYETTLATVESIARRENFDLAVNGSYFGARQDNVIASHVDPYVTGNWAVASGLTMSDGQLWSAHPIEPAFPSLWISSDGSAHIEFLQQLPSDAKQIVSGAQWLVQNGKSRISFDSPPSPRTAVGVSADGRTLVLIVADGHRPDYALGLTFEEMAQEMIRQKCRDAISLDSGGSSTMVLRTSIPAGAGPDWHVMNFPSDGSQVSIPMTPPISIARPVANALGITLLDRVTTRPTGK